MTATPITTAEADQLLAPLAGHARVALAVSGGPDSLALLQLSVDFARRNGLSMPLVLTVDHALRPGSRSEAEMVARIADVLGAPHALLTWQHGAVDAGVQAQARAARYDLMAAHCAAHDIAALVTAHQLDDQAETFLMRLKRGSGLDGLAAIPEKGRWGGLTILRPLLEVPKARLVATTEAAGLPFVFDPSNNDPRFERVRLRGAMAALAEMGFEAEAIALSARRLRRARAALEAAADAFLAAHGERSPAGYASLPLFYLRAAPQDVALRVLGRIVATVGGLSEPVQLAKLESLFEALLRDGCATQTLGRCQILSQGGRLVVVRELRKSGLPIATLQPGEKVLWDNRFQIALGAGGSEPITVEALGEEGLRHLTEDKGGALAIPRAAALALPACRYASGALVLPDFGAEAAFFAASAPPQGLRSWSGHDGRVDCQARFLWGAD